MRRSMKLTGLVLAGAMAALGARAENETVALFTKNNTNPFFQAVRVGSAAAARALGATVTNFVPTKPDSIPEQMSQVEDVIVKRPDVIIFIPVDYKAMVPAVEKINTAGIPVVNIVDKMAGGKTLAFVGADDHALGVAAGRALVDAMGGKGNVVILEGVRGSISNVDRVAGLRDALKEAPQIKLLASQPANFQRLNALQAMENILQAHPDIDGVMAANDSMAIGAIEALEGANRKALVVGINGTQEAIDAIKSGKLLGTASADPFMQGCLGTLLAIRALRHLPVPASHVLAPVFVNRDTYGPYDVPVEQRVCPTWEAAGL